MWNFFPMIMAATLLEQAGTVGMPHSPARLEEAHPQLWQL